MKRRDERNFRIAINVSVFSLKGYLGTHNYLSRSESPSQKQTLGMVFGTCSVSERLQTLGCLTKHVQTDFPRSQVRHHSPRVSKTLRVTRSPKKLPAQMSDLTHTHQSSPHPCKSLTSQHSPQPTPDKTKNTCASCQTELSLKAKALSLHSLQPCSEALPFRIPLKALLDSMRPQTRTREP